MKLINIGLPVLNEGKYLSQSIDSLLDQDFSDFDIFICDNASVDNTMEVAQEYVKKDSRVKYYRNKERVSAFQNWNKTFNLTNGQYFMWASGHDLWDKNHLSSCLNVLERERETVLAYGLTGLVDDDSNIIRISLNRLDTKNLGKISRFNKWVLASNDCSCIQGLIRSESIKKTRLLQEVLGADILFLSELSLLGYFTQIEKPLYYSRQIRPQETPVAAAQRRIDWLYYGKKKCSLVFCLLHLTYKYLETISGMSIELHNKIILFFFTFYDLGMLYTKTILRYINVTKQYY